MNSGIGYRGRVQIKIKNKPPVKIKNTGTISLFELFGFVLDRSVVTPETYDLFVSRLPMYIDIVYGLPVADGNLLKLSDKYNSIISQDVGKTLKSCSLLRAPILLSTYERGTDDDGYEATIRYQAVINSANINTNTLTQDASAVSKGYIYLVDSAQEHVLAFVEVDMNVVRNIANDEYGQAILTWDMLVGNKV